MVNSIIAAYTSLPSSSSASSPASRADVSNVLQSIIDAPAFTFDQSSRTELIRLLLRDLKSTKGRLTSKDAAQALLALKTVGRIPSGSDGLAEAGSLSTLLGLSSSLLKEDLNASSEALRVIANTLLLHESARSTLLSKDVNGGETCVAMLDKSTSPDLTFILARILFLCTASGPSYIQSLVEDKRHGRTVVDIISAKLESLLVNILNGQRMAKEAMTDVLKFAFNILMHYPKLVDCEPQTADAGDDGIKVLGDFWSPKLDGLLPPLLRVFTSLPPTFPSPLTSPLTHVIHALITIPVSPELRPIWLGTSSSSTSSSSSPTTTTSNALAGGSTSASNSPKSTSTHLATRSSSSANSRSDSPVRPAPPSSTTPPKPSTLDRALSVLSAGRRSLSRSPSPAPPPLHPVNAYAVVQRVQDLLDVSFAHYFPGTIDPDDPSVRARPKAESPDPINAGSVEDILTPLTALLGRLAAADEGVRTRVREWMVPADLDRSSEDGGLAGRGDILGRCLRVMSCVYHARLKDGVGEMLFAVCDSDPSIMSMLLGYGNVAGFLFNKGIMTAPPPPTASSSSSSAAAAAAALADPTKGQINPITGTLESKKPADELPEMTEEEKEREMEKLFVLFDRLERRGDIPASQNPMRKVIEKAQAS